MRHVYAVHLPLVGEPEKVLPLARAVVKQSIAAAAGRAWPAEGDELEGSWTSADHHVRWRRLDDGRERLFECRWRHPFPRDPSLRWHTLVLIGVQRDRPLVFARRSLESLSSRLTDTVRFNIEPPALVGGLLARLEVHDAGSRCTTSSTAVTTDEVVGRVATLLTHPSRRLPVITVHGCAVGVAESIARHLGGLAHVFDADVPSTERLAGYLSSAAAGPMTIRLYWPGYHPGGLERVQPFRDLPERPGEPLGYKVISTVCAASAFRLDEPEVSARLDAAAARARIAQAETRGASMADVPPDVLEHWEADLQRLERAEQERADAVEQLDVLRESLAQVYEQWADEVAAAAHRSRALRSGDTSAARPARHGDPADLVEVLDWVQEDCGGLVVTPEARDAASRHRFSRPRVVYDALVILDGLVARWRAGDLPGGFGLAAEASGLPWRRRISDTAAQQFASDYTATYRGTKVLCGPHLVWGNSVENHVRVYLYLDKERCTVAIGRTGRHGRDATNPDRP